MAQTLIRVFHSMDAAQHARRELLESGFPPAQVELDATEDEAGPVEGNFVMDEKDTGKGPARSRLSRLLGMEERTDAYNKDTPVWRSCCRMTVEVADDAQATRAADILERFGAVDIDRKTRAGGLH
jgi:hypothetical protein